MDFELILKNLVRTGTVTDVNNDERIARVLYPDEGDPSGWLHVLASQPYIPVLYLPGSVAPWTSTYFFLKEKVGKKNFSLQNEREHSSLSFCG